MSEENTPRKGDRVRVTYEGEYEPTPNGALLVTVGSPKRSIFDDAKVEVLERADDPSKDPVGTVRRSPDGVVAAKSRNPDYPWRGFGEPCGENFATVSVIGWPVIGAVPGTPAATPREFPSDGPEPPPNVRVVTDGAKGVPFLVRYGDHWRWARGLDHPEDFAYTGGSWKDVISQMEKPVTFTEVI